jgi:hypothetical protein
METETAMSNPNKPNSFDMHTLIFSVRHWHDGTSTYHSLRVVAVMRDGSRWEGCIPFVYGGGGHYLCGVSEMLELPCPSYAISRWARANHVHLLVDVVEVKRRKDLHLGGRGKGEPLELEPCLWGSSNKLG